MELALKLFLCLFGFQFLLSVCKGALTVSNRHTAMAVVVGSKSTLTCSSDVTIQHTFSWVINSQTIVATNSFAGTRYCEVLPGYTTRYNVSAPSDGSYCNLIILNATMDEAGSYTCSDTAPQVPVMINLNVLNSGSNCSTSTDAVNNTVVSPENVTMYCSIQFGGWAPDLIWNPTGLTSNGTSGNTTYSTAYSTLNYNSNDATSLWPYKIPSYTCSVVYNSSVYVVTPISSCSTKEVNVLWCPRAINISGANTDESIKYGDLLTCSASGNPSPKYQWFDSANKSLATGPSLRVTEIGNYTCIASNNARSSQCSTPLRQNIANVKTDLALILGLVLGLGIPCLLLIMGCCIWYFWCYSKRQKQQKQQNEVGPQPGLQPPPKPQPAKKEKKEKKAKKEKKEKNEKKERKEKEENQHN